jgi:hypothetical protein
MDPTLLSFDPNSPAAQTVVTTAGYLSLALIFIAFGLIATLSMRSRTVSSFQFELYVFVLVVVMAEVPKILIDLGFLPALQQYELDGLIVHSFSMAFLSGFVLWRAYKAFGNGTGRKTKKESISDSKNVEVVKEKTKRKI